MTTKNFFIFQAFVCLVYGIPLLLAPEFFINLSALSKIEMTSKLENISRGYATALMGIGVASFLVRDALPSLARRGFFVLAFVANTLVTFVNIRSILRGDENNSAWITVLLTAFLSVWSGWLWSKDKGLVLE